MADGKYLSTLSGSELDAALRAATTVKEKVRAELQYAKDSGEFDGPQGIQGLQGPMGTLGQAGQIQDFESAAAVAGPSFNYYASFSTPLIEGIDGSKICGVTTLPANLWRYQMFLLGYSDLPTILMRRLGEDNTPEELEWVNPPMEWDSENQEGYIYRTIRRFNGKPIYTTRIQFSMYYKTEISIRADVATNFELINVNGTVDGSHLIEIRDDGAPVYQNGSATFGRYSDKVLIIGRSDGWLDIHIDSSLNQSNNAGELTADLVIEYTRD